MCLNSVFESELKKEWPKNRAINLVFHGQSVPAGYFKTPEVNTLAAYPALVLKAIKAQSQQIEVILLTPSPDQRVDYSDPDNKLRKQTDQIIGLAEDHQVGLADS